jgi:hypothetical protein
MTIEGDETMARRKKIEDMPLERLFEELDKQVQDRGQAVLAERDTTEEIKRVAVELSRREVPMREIGQHVKRMNPETRKLEPVSRQAIALMLAIVQGRREPDTRGARRRRQEQASTPAGRLNADVLS